MLLAHRFGMMGYGWGWGGIVLGSLFLIALVVLIVLSLRNTIRLGKGKQSEESPLDILKKRYVKGDISKNDFDSMKKDIAE